MSVYFITCRAIHAVKIGYSDNPGFRFSKVQSDCPLPLALEATCEAGLEYEAELHARFADAKMRGEWFHITPAINDLIDTFRVVEEDKEAVHALVSDDPTDVEMFSSFRSIAAMARQLDVPVTTAHGWTKRGIPSWRKAQILTLLRPDPDLAAATPDAAAAA